MMRTSNPALSEKAFNDAIGTAAGRPMTLDGTVNKTGILLVLAVLSAMAGSAYWPDFRGAILFLEDINEYIYRVDRMLATLRLAGAFRQLAGVVLGQFSKCEPGDGNYGTLTLDEVFEDYFGALGVPVYRGAMIGHIPRKFTLPIGEIGKAHV